MTTDFPIPHRAFRGCGFFSFFLSVRAGEEPARHCKTSGKFFCVASAGPSSFPKPKTPLVRKRKRRDREIKIHLKKYICGDL